MEVTTEELDRLLFKPYKISIRIDTWDEHELLKKDINIFIEHLNEVKSRPTFKGFHRSGLMELISNILKAVPEKSRPDEYNKKNS